MGLSKRKEDQLFTWGDYMTWPDDERWELIDGVAYQMAPASTNHHRVARKLLYQFEHYLQNKTCEVFDSLGVRLPREDEPDEYIKDALIPDISVVCNPEQLDDAGCKGAPNLVIEILSPSTAAIDMKVKRFKYETAGVKEYWIVDIHHKTVMVLKPGDNKYGSPEVYTEEDKIKVGIFEDLEIDLAPVFSGM
jgi:Uma2 family endonuclease